jgi:hypothetical protein
MQLEPTWDEVDTRTHTIMHLENAVEMQDIEHDDREEQITTLVQKVHELQIHVPTTLEEDPDKAELMSGVEDG